MQPLKSKISPHEITNNRTSLATPLSILIGTLIMLFILIRGLSGVAAEETAVSSTQYLPFITKPYHPDQPIINDFSINTEQVAAGESITLSWNISRTAESVTLEPGSVDVTGLGSIVVVPTDSTIFILTASNDAGVNVKQISITVVQLPAISSFSPLSETINLGDVTTLNWTVENSVDSLTLDPGLGEVVGLTSKVVSPTVTTVYTLTASNFAGMHGTQTTVFVTQPPIINQFLASPPTIDKGDSSTLSWSISNLVDSVTISDGVGDVTGLNQIDDSPDQDTTYILTAVGPAGTVSETVSVTVIQPPTELLVFDWNEKVQKSHRGFPWDEEGEILANGDWTSPTNFAGGTLYFRAEIISQPTPQANMQLQFCIWQSDGLETCGSLHTVPGTSGTVRTWDSNISLMWKKDGNPLDWDRPRFRNGVAIKNGAGNPVSNYEGWNWFGENPDHWYPLDMRFTVVVVAEGETFSGWNNYIP